MSILLNKTKIKECGKRRKGKSQNIQIHAWNVHINNMNVEPFRRACVRENSERRRGSLGPSILRAAGHAIVYKGRPNRPPQHTAGNARVKHIPSTLNFSLLTLPLIQGSKSYTTLNWHILFQCLEFVETWGSSQENIFADMGQFSQLWVLVPLLTRVGRVWRDIANTCHDLLPTLWGTLGQLMALSSTQSTYHSTWNTLNSTSRSRKSISIKQNTSKATEQIKRYSVI